MKTKTKSVSIGRKTGNSKKITKKKVKLNQKESVTSKFYLNRLVRFLSNFKTKML